MCPRINYSNTMKYFRYIFSFFLIKIIFVKQKKKTFKRIRKRSDSVIWHKPLHTQKNPKSNVTTQKKNDEKIISSYIYIQCIKLRDHFLSKEKLVIFHVSIVLHHTNISAARLISAESTKNESSVIQGELSPNVTVSDTIEIRPGQNNETGIVVKRA